MKRFVYVQNWEESERGWGTRPDGVSAHLTLDDVKAYVLKALENQKEFFVGRGITGVPDEYSRTCGEPILKEVNNKVYQIVKNSKNGVRFDKISDLN